MQEVTDYTPFGATNNHDQLAGCSEERKFTGQEYDSTTNLNYFNARYQDPVRGQFISEDPAIVTLNSNTAIGDPTAAPVGAFLNSKPKSDSYLTRGTFELGRHNHIANRTTSHQFFRSQSVPPTAYLAIKT
jgi:RHS repeat-associated protein